MLNNKFADVAAMLQGKAFEVMATDFNRPWGGFFVINENQSAQFIEEYFPDIDRDVTLAGGKISPKILVVAPKKRLSWQYHFRRAERWKVLAGPVAIALSETDEQPIANIYPAGEEVVLGQGTRHRLIGLDDYGIVAEIWQHTDPAHPSDEEDIVRVQDDFKRK